MRSDGVPAPSHGLARSRSASFFYSERARQFSLRPPSRHVPMRRTQLQSGFPEAATSTSPAGSAIATTTTRSCFPERPGARTTTRTSATEPLTLRPRPHRSEMDRQLVISKPMRLPTGHPPCTRRLTSPAAGRDPLLHETRDGVDRLDTRWAEDGRRRSERPPPPAEGHRLVELRRWRREALRHRAAMLRGERPDLQRALPELLERKERRQPGSQASHVLLVGGILSRVAPCAATDDLARHDLLLDLSTRTALVREVRRAR